MISPRNVDFEVQLSLDVTGSGSEPSVHFSVVGQPSDSGGTVTVHQSNTVAGGGGTQNDCTLAIAPPSGVIAKGKIWGGFECNAFKNELDLGDTGCDVRGQLLFENCD
jgi:hypothetical protein